MAWYSNGPLTRLAAITSSALDDVTRVRRAWHWDTPRPRTWPEQGAVVPPPPSDLDCADFAPLKNFPVRHDLPDSDPHHLDGNGDGIACEPEDY